MEGISIDLGATTVAAAATDRDRRTVRREVGLWIDHRRALVVTLSGQHEEVREVISDLERLVRMAGAQESSREDLRDGWFAGDLNYYYGRVVGRLRDADAILIFGPGDAKTELVERLGHGTLGRCVVGIETVDKMTDRQIVARVRQHFLESERTLHD